MALPAPRAGRRGGANGVLDDEDAVVHGCAVERAQGGGGMLDVLKLDEGEALLQVEAHDRSEGAEFVVEGLTGGLLRVEVDDEEGLAGL